MCTTTKVPFKVSSLQEAILGIKCINLRRKGSIYRTVKGSKIYALDAQNSFLE